MTGRSVIAGAEPLLTTLSKPIVSAPPCRTGWPTLEWFCCVLPSGASGCQCGPTRFLPAETRFCVAERCRLPRNSSVYSATFNP